ncbi:MAG: AI-2E family transporter [Elusimicrobiota bacterium]|nr:MAG: AI-2E family transporter [Elusimicrobiota bacterium]
MSERREFPLVPVLLLGGLAAYAFFRLHHALAPFLLAAAFAYVLNPVVVYFEARGFKRLHLVAGGYLAAAALSFFVYTGLKGVIVEETELLQNRAPAYIQRLKTTAAVQQAALTKKLPLPPKVAEHALESALGGALHAVQELPSRVLALLPFLAHALLIPFIGFFFLMDGPSGVEGLIQFCPSRFVEQAIHLLSEIDTALGNYLRGLFIVMTVIFIVSFFGLVALGIDNALIIAAISGVSSVVPYFGLVMGILIGGAMAFYQFGTAAAALKVAALFLGIRAFEETLIQPIIARHSLHMHAMTNLLVLILGGELFGFLGLVFAVPAAGVLKALATVTWSWYTSERGFDSGGAAGAGVPYT